MRRGLDRSHASGFEAGRRRESQRNHRPRHLCLGRRHALDLPCWLDAPDELQDRAGRLRADATQRPDVWALQRRQPLDDRDALPVRGVHKLARGRRRLDGDRHAARPDRKSTRLNSSHLVISYAVFCLKKKKHSTQMEEPPYIEFDVIPVIIGANTQADPRRSSTLFDLSPAQVSAIAYESTGQYALVII